MHHERPPLALQLVFMGKYLDHLIEHKLAVHGLNRTQALTLMALRHHEGLNAMALCAHARVEPANVSRTLQSLERLDLVERRPHPTDGRAQLFYLTAAGQSAAETVGGTMRQISSEILGSMDDKEVRGLESGLHGLWRTMRRRLEVESYRMTAVSNQPSATSSQPSTISDQLSAVVGHARERDSVDTTVLRDEGAEGRSLEDNSESERRRLTADR